MWTTRFAPGLARRGDHVARALGVDAVEDARIGEPLLEQAHAVEGRVDALGGSPQRRRIAHVSLRQLDAAGNSSRALAGFAHQGDHLVAALGQLPRDGVADLSGRAGDEGPHRQVTLSWPPHAVGCPTRRIPSSSG